MAEATNALPAFVDFTVLALGSGAIGGFITKWWEGRSAKARERRDGLAAQLDRRESAHLEASHRLIGTVASMHAFVQSLEATAGGNYSGLLIGYTPSAGEITSISELLSTLTNISLQHPTKSVRERAHQLRESVFNFGVEPSDERDWDERELHEFTSWLQRLEEIAIRMHLPGIGQDLDERLARWRELSHEDLGPREAA